MLFIFFKFLRGMVWKKRLKPDLVIGQRVLALDDFIELVDDDGGELGHGLPFKLRAHLEVNQRVLHEGEEPVGEGHAVEHEAQPPHH